MIVKKLDRKSIQYAELINKIRDFKLDQDRFIHFVSNPNNLAYYMLDDEKVVAFGWAYLLERMDDASMLYIHSIDVLEPYRNKGYGKKLLGAFLEYAKKKNLRNTFLITDQGNIPANKLYQSYTEEKEDEKVLYVFKNRWVKR